jgi:hypothetical protein
MATEGSWIPEGVGATLNDLVGLYSQVESVKLTNQLARAKASAEAFGMPSSLSNPQANAATANKPIGAVNPWLIGGAVGVALIVVYSLVK